MCDYKFHATANVLFVFSDTVDVILLSKPYADRFAIGQ